jgi:transcriptional regulator with XRE-family HTH domain
MIRMNNFGRKLRELREQAGMTQPDLATKAGLSAGGVSQIEQGRREPGWSTVQALAAALGVNCLAFEDPPSAGTQPRGRGRPKKGQDIPTAAPAKRTGKKMPGKPKRGPEKL